MSSSSSTGFTWINPTSINTHFFECIICKQFLDDPRQCNQCDKPFCDNCIGTWSKISRECPCCKQNIVPRPFNLLLKSVWSELKIQCAVCNEVCERGDWVAHRDKYCKVECPYCTQKVQKQSIDKHEQDECDAYIVPCPAQQEISRLGVKWDECKVQVVRKNIGLHQCDLMKFLPLLKQIDTFDRNQMVICNFKVGDSIDYRRSVVERWITATVVAIDTQTGFVRVERDDNYKVESTTIGSDFIARHGTHSSHSQPGNMIHRSHLRPGMMHSVTTHSDRLVYTVVKVCSSDVGEQRIYHVRHPCRSCGEWSLQLLESEEVQLFSDLDNLRLVSDDGDLQIRQGMLVCQNGHNLLITGKHGENILYRYFNKNRNYLGAEDYMLFMPTRDTTTICS